MEESRYCKIVDCTNNLAEELCPKTCSKQKFCKIADCTKADSMKLCPKTCAERPKEDSGKNNKTKQLVSYE